MSKPIILVSSVTYAIKSKGILFDHGIKAYVERIPRTKESGCGYGVYVPNGVEHAEQILKDFSIKILGRYNGEADDTR